MRDRLDRSHIVLTYVVRQDIAEGRQLARKSRPVTGDIPLRRFQEFLLALSTVKSVSPAVIV